MDGWMDGWMDGGRARTPRAACGAAGGRGQPEQTAKRRSPLDWSDRLGSPVRHRLTRLILIRRPHGHAGRSPLATLAGRWSRALGPSAGARTAVRAHLRSRVCSAVRSARGAAMAEAPS